VTFVLAAAAVTFGLLAVAEAAAAAWGRAARRAPAAAAALRALADAVLRLGREGREPGALERRRLLVAGAVAAAGLGALALGPAAGAALGAAGPAAVARVLRIRREHYRGGVDAAAPAIALAVADAVSGGHSLRGALIEAARGASGPGGHELRRVAAELAAGARTEAALDALRARARSERIDLLVTACLLQHRAGGDVARLLRDCAESFEDDARLRGDVRAATAQARFTGVVVVLLPLGGALLAELASPGFAAALLASGPALALVAVALALQLCAAAMIHRLGSVRW
jgi:tight adherence protein B